MHNAMLTMFLTCVLVAYLPGCKKSEPPAKTDATPSATAAPSPNTHTHPDGTTHTDEQSAAATTAEDHAHDEAPLETITIGELKVELAQGHGKVEAGKEGHLVVKLPYNDKGQTIVRAWLGAEDRTLSTVGKGEYAPSHDDYDIHAVAPDPLPENVMWWIEIQKPDGATLLGSAKPLMD